MVRLVVAVPLTVVTFIMVWVIINDHDDMVMMVMRTMAVVVTVVVFVVHT